MCSSDLMLPLPARNYCRFIPALTAPESPTIRVPACSEPAPCSSPDCPRHAACRAQLASQIVTFLMHIERGTASQPFQGPHADRINISKHHNLLRSMHRSKAYQPDVRRRAMIGFPSPSRAQMSRHASPRLTYKIEAGCEKLRVVS